MLHPYYNFNIIYSKGEKQCIGQFLLWALHSRKVGRYYTYHQKNFVLMIEMFHKLRRQFLITNFEGCSRDKPTWKNKRN